MATKLVSAGLGERPAVSGICNELYLGTVAKFARIEMADDKKEDTTDGMPAPGQGVPPNLANIAPSGATPFQPPPGVNPQAFGPLMALQLGFGPQQQNPEVMKHMTTFLSHDSDNRLTAMESAGKRNHTFRMTMLIVGVAIVFCVLIVPLFVQLYKGDLSFVDKLLSTYLPVIGAVVLALFAGPKVSELFKG